MAATAIVPEDVDVGVFVVQHDRLGFVNHRFAEMTGRMREELTGVSLADLFVPADRRAINESLGDSEGLIVAHLKRADAKPLEVDIRLWGGELEGGSTSVGFVRDLEALRELERHQTILHEKIEHAAEEWRLTFDAVETPIIIIDSDGAVQRINRAARMIAGKSYEEIIRHPAQSLGSHEPWVVIRALAESVLRDGSPAAGHVQTDDARTWDVLAMPFQVPGADSERVLVAAWDVTQIVELQASLDQARTMAEIGGVVAGVAHEVRNPLFAISATLDALEQASGGEYPEFFSVLHEEIDRMVKLMQHLLDYGRPARPQFTYDESLEAVVDRAIAACASLAAADEVIIEKLMDPEQPALFLDPDRLARAIENLVNNAVLHSPKGGRVGVHLFRADDVHQSWLFIRVEDDGPGIPPDHLVRIFEPFFTQRRGGTGLGLSMVRQIAEEHGGKVWAENRPDGGGALVMRLPLQTGRPEPEPEN